MSENNICPLCGGKIVTIYPELTTYIKEVRKCLDCGHTFSLKIRCPKCGEMITIDADLWLDDEGVVMGGD